MQIGLLLHGNNLGDPATGLRASAAARQRAIVEQAVRAESLGFDSVWLGAQRPRDPVLASPSVLLAAMAARTARVRLGSTLLANLDPVRVAEDYATLDVLSGGRVEVVAADTSEASREDRERHREHLEVLLRVWRETAVTWSGRFRPPLDAVTVEPRPVQKPHPPVWVGGVASQQSADLAAALGLPLLLSGTAVPAIDLAPLVARYRERLAAAGHDPSAARVGCWEAVHAGSPAELVDRIATAREALGLDLHVAAFDQGGLPPAALSRALDLYATHVAPHLRQLGAGPEM